MLTGKTMCLDLFYSSLVSKQNEFNSKQTIPLLVKRIHFNDFMNQIYGKKDIYVFYQDLF